jgi:hypothetical protein
MFIHRKLRRTVRFGPGMPGNLQPGYRNCGTPRKLATSVVPERSEPLRALPKTPGHRARRSCPGMPRMARSREPSEARQPAAGCPQGGAKRRQRRISLWIRNPGMPGPDAANPSRLSGCAAFGVVLRSASVIRLRRTPSASPCTTPKSAATRCPGVFGSALNQVAGSLPLCGAPSGRESIGAFHRSEFVPVSSS